MFFNDKDWVMASKMCYLLNIYFAILFSMELLMQLIYLKKKISENNSGSGCTVSNVTEKKFTTLFISCFQPTVNTVDF